MTFISVLIGLLVERFFDCSHLRKWHWFLRYQTWLNQHFSHLPPLVLFLFCIAPPIILVAVIQSLLTGWAYNFFKLVFDVAVLLYCFGPRNLWVDSYASLNALLHDEHDVASKKIQQVFGLNLSAHDSQMSHRQLVSKIFIESVQRIFSVLFWFVILGPIGAVLYRSIYFVFTQQEESIKNLNLLNYSLFAKKLLDWLPIRVITFIFALCGHFVKVLHIWKKNVGQKLSHNAVLLVDCGVAAADIEPTENLKEDGSAENAVLALLDRSLVVSLVILALGVLVI